MPDANRYLNLIDGLKAEDEPIEKPTEKPASKAEPKKRKKTKAPKKPPTARSTDGPKIPRINRSSVAKSKNPDFEKATYYLPKTTTRKMRLHAVEFEIEMSYLVNAAVIAYLENQQQADE